MRERINSIVIILLFALIGLYGFILFETTLVSAAGITIYVDDDNTGFEDGSITNPYNTIMEGIIASTNGDTVFVFNGTYVEHVTVNKTINLTGENRSNTIIDGGGSGDTVRVTSDWVNITGFLITNAGLNFGDVGLELYYVDNCKVHDNNVSSNGANGIYLLYSNYNAIFNNVGGNDPWGTLILEYSHNNIVTNNTISNTQDGILITESNNNIVNNNYLHSNTQDGIHLSSAINNTIRNNIVSNNKWGISLYNSNRNKVFNNTMEFSTYEGLAIDRANNNSISNNTISNNDYGIWGWESDNNIIINNTISSNWMSFNLDYSCEYNEIYHNNIIDCNFVYDYGINQWDNDYPSGGNYWSDYSGIDQYSGSNQDQPGSDGIGDTDYPISGGSNQDRYPLMYPVGIPTQPQNLQVIRGDQNVTLTWDPPISDGGYPITNYRIYRGTTSGGESFLIEVGNVTTYFDSGLTNGQEYYYYVTAVNSYDEGWQSEEISATPATFPTEPTGLMATDGDSFVYLNWTQPNSDGGSLITNYRIYRGTISGGETFLLEIGNSTTYNDTSVINGITYFYIISAVNDVGEGNFSNEINGTPLGLPSTPQNIVLYPGDAYINITWNYPSSDGGTPILNYRIYRGTSPGAEIFYIEIGNITFFNDTNVINGITYYYNISAVNIIGEGPLSDEVGATPGAAPSEPQNPIAFAEDTYINISWSPPIQNGGFSISNYLIYRGATPGGESFFIEIGNVTYYNDTTVINGITYYYRISAKNAVGESILSNEISGIPLGPPSAPLNPLIVSGDYYLNLSWNEPTLNGGTPITNYIIYRGTSSGGEVFLVEIGNITYYNDTSVINGITYYYKISAKNSVGEGGSSIEISSTPSTLPASPEGLIPVGGDSYVNLSWNSPLSDGGSGITNYLIYRGDIPGGETFLIQIGNITYHNDTTVVNGQTYYYKVSAKNGAGEGPLSNEANFTPLSVPSEPRNLQSSRGDSFINLSWEYPLLNGGTPITNFRIYRGTTPDGEVFLVETGNITFYNDTGATNGITYYYKVSSRNIVGEGPLSNENSNTPGTIPTSPKNLDSTSGDSYVSLTWESPDSDGGFPITNYLIYRGPSSGNETFLIEIGNALLYNDTSVINGVTYYYMILAKNEIGEGPFSVEKNSTPLATPSAPRNISIGSGNSYLVITWDVPLTDGGTPITNYTVYRGSSSGNELFLIELGNVFTYNDTSVLNGNEYYYKIRAVNIVGEGAYSQGVNTIPGTVPTQPLNLTATSGRLYINLTWEQPLDNGGYDIVSFNIYRDEAPGGKTFLRQIINLTYYNDTGLTENVKYYYKVSAVNAIGEGPLSDETVAELLKAPSEPLSLEAYWGNEYIRLNWSAPASDGGISIDNYIIYRKIGQTGIYSLIEVVGNNLSYNDTNVNNGQTYYYKVVAVNSIGHSQPSNEVDATPKTTPSNPLELKVVIEDGFLKLIWKIPNSDGGSPIIGYMIYKGETQDEKPLKIEVGNILFYNDTSVLTGKIYYYEISAINELGEGNVSNEANGTAASHPNSPDDLTGIYGDSFINITWSTPIYDGGSPITNYILYRGYSLGNETYFKRIYDVTYYNDTKVTNGIKYYYRVSSENGIGEGPLSEPLEITPAKIPAEPRNLRVDVGDGFVNLRWDAPLSNGGSGIENYSIYRGSDPYNLSLLRTIGNLSEYNDTNVINGQEYYYIITAINEMGEGPNSRRIEAVPVDPSDVDSDGLPDSWELEYFGNTDQDPDEDFDKDGFNNLDEYDQGTDPSDKKDYPGFIESREDESSILPVIMVLLIVVVIFIVLMIFSMRRRKDKESVRIPDEQSEDQFESEASDPEDLFIIDETEDSGRV